MSEQADTIEPVAEATPAEADGWSWAVLEVFGHRRHSGRVREEERFGAKMLRIDVPNQGDPAAHGWTTHLYGGSAIFYASLCRLIGNGHVIGIEKGLRCKAKVNRHPLGALIKLIEGDSVGAERNYKFIFQNTNWQSSASYTNTLYYPAQMMAGRAAVSRNMRW